MTRPTSDHKYNQDYHTDGEPFNNEPQPSFNSADESSRECSERIKRLIDTTKRELHGE